MLQQYLTIHFQSLEDNAMLYSLPNPLPCRQDEELFVKLGGEVRKSKLSSTSMSQSHSFLWHVLSFDYHFGALLIFSCVHFRTVSQSFRFGFSANLWQDPGSHPKIWCLWCQPNFRPGLNIVKCTEPWSIQKVDHCRHSGMIIVYNDYIHSMVMFFFRTNSVMYSCRFGTHTVNLQLGKDLNTSET